MLARAFQDDPAWEWVVPNPKRRAALLPWLFQVNFEVTEAEAWVTAGAIEGCARWLPPGRAQIHVGPMLRALVATPVRVREATSRFLAYGRAVEGMRAAAIPEPHWYLAGIGVDPPRWRAGIGTALMRPGFEASRRDGVPCALLTNNEANVDVLRQPRLRGRPRGPDARRRAAGLGDAARRLRLGLPPMTEPKRFPGRAEIASVRAEAELLDPDTEAASERRLAGRVLARRDLGKLTFLDLVDRSGRIQLLCSADRAGEVDVHLGDIVGAIGYPAKSRRGEPSLAVMALELLAPIRTPLPGYVPRSDRRRAAPAPPLPRPDDERRDPRGVRPAGPRSSPRIRRTLDDEGFIEVETPILQPRYGGAFARPFSTHHNELDQTLYLRIATELYLKRLIVGGLERVYELGKDFRNEGVSYKHNPEFTMLEWYEAYADYRDTMDRMERLVARVAEETLGRTVVSFRGNEIDLASVAPGQARRRAGRARPLDPRRGRRSGRRCASAASTTSHDRTWAQLVDHALSHFVEPTLIQPTILHDYPVELSPFARAAEEEGMVERFEYYAGGMELGNAFTEINDSRGAGRAVSRFRRPRGRAGTSRPSPATPTTSRRSPTACRRQAASGWGSTGWRCSCSARTRSVT